MPIVEFDNVSFSYADGTRALDGVSLTVEQGEFVCMIGSNGSGKSTFARHVNGLLVPDGGCVRVAGMDTADAAHTYEIRKRAGMVFQNPDDQLVASIVEDDVAFGPENLGIEPGRLRELVAESLESVDLAGFERRETATLSGGQKQRVAIAGVLAMHPDVIVFDEATAMLDPRGRDRFMAVCDKLNADGMAIVLITHFMDETVHASRVIALDKGRVALDGTPGQVFAQVEELKRLGLDVPFAVRMSRALQEEGLAVSMCVDEAGLIGQLAALESPAAETHASEARAEGEPETGQIATETAGQAPLLAFDHVSFAYGPSKKRSRKRGSNGASRETPDTPWALEDVSFTLHRGEFLGIAGHTSAGKSTLMQLCNGLLAPTRGSVAVDGRDIAGKKAAADARRDIGIVFQYPEHQLFAATVFDDVAFGPRNLGLGEDEVARRVEEALRLVHLDVDEVRDASPFALSGGQQRRVAFAGVLAMRPRALVLDEPAAGLDPRSKASFLDLISEFHRTRDMAVVLVSHDMDDLGAYCERIIVLDRGRICAAGTPRQVFADERLLSSIGLDVPNAVRLENRLGLERASSIPTVRELAKRIARRSGRPRT